MYEVGYTTGVFDLFHTGHLNILYRSKAQCKKLIVGVSSDELVFEYKGRHTIVTLDQRIDILNALRCVDQVVVQSSLDKIKAWESLRFNVHFHGDDWKGTKVFGDAAFQLEQRGVDSVFFPYTEGTSTTSLKQKIYSAMAQADE
jgi:glycerol-3-phosphate cytidylyltransferase